MLDRSAHTRTLNKLRKREEAKRKRAGVNQPRHYALWLSDDEAVEVVLDARRIDHPSKRVIEDLRRIDSIDRTISNKEYREIVGRLVRVNYKRFKAALEK